MPINPPKKSSVFISQIKTEIIGKSFIRVITSGVFITISEFMKKVHTRCQ